MNLTLGAHIPLREFSRNYFLADENNVRNKGNFRRRRPGDMTDAVIAEHEGSRRGAIVRYYQYGNGGVRVLDGGKVIRRLYYFDPSSNMMTERDPSRQEKILRRFVFDSYGMLEETFSFGHSPRTFKFEAGGQRIAVREGGDYGAVGKLFTFEENGISETGWGRNGEIERVYVFEPGDDAITERSGGWFGNVDRTIVFEGIRASVFREPEAFLQFLVFTEWSESDRDAAINEQVAKIRAGDKGAGRNPYAFRPASAGGAAGRGAASQARGSGRRSDDPGIDFIADADGSAPAIPRGPGPAAARRGVGASFDDRRQERDRAVQDRYTDVRSDELDLQERFEAARSGRGELSKGRSVEIPIAERFAGAREKEQLSRGRSVDIPIEERFAGAREKEQLSRGRSVDIPLEERFEGAREKEQLSRGGSVDIPLDERFESARREREKLSRGKSADIPYSERRGGNR
jgi:hypothetical protein